VTYHVGDCTRSCGSDANSAWFDTDIVSTMGDVDRWARFNDRFEVDQTSVSKEIHFEAGNHATAH